MANDDARGEAIRAFFEAPGNENLFPNCPFRRELSHLHECDAASGDMILGHMLGHIIDHRAGQPCRNESGEMISAISQDNIQHELRFVYNDCNNPRLNEDRQSGADLDPAVLDPYQYPEYHGFDPEQRGCFGADSRAELMAEAIRTYMRDPNYLKTVAPNVAARIRAAVNPNPALNKIIQFN
ncbi:hypothetical protein [Bosea sp. 685]|uniref:hypothetical protein n=1 Tax=Bosea sp. 685 TaxID=3080057 RepID=UPI002893439B|nr:hypothetical protein [Bosea sp. 685]WNJ93616.1 hypothetical protein RMR04_15560 [Bosea sp. 685]